MVSSIVFAAAVYVIVWWLSLFIILPIGIESQAEKGRVARGSERGAPAKPVMLKKLLLTTLISAIIFGTLYGLWQAGIIDQYVMPQKYLSDRIRS
jgi:predicted secreted protein